MDAWPRAVLYGCVEHGTEWTIVFGRWAELAFVADTLEVENGRVVLMLQVLDRLRQVLRKAQTLLQ